MKKTLLVSLVIMSVISMQAQKYEVGQVIPQGTWSALVVYVDESGEHGLLMSPTAMREGSVALQAAANAAGMPVEELIASLPLPLLAKGEKDSKIVKVMKEMVKQNLNSTNGVDNCKNIADYCEANGIAMEAYFPEATWAASLGEGWFIPGTDELELYAGVIAKGVGKEKDKKLSGLTNYDDIRKGLNQKLTADYQSGETGGVMMSFPSSICSSTFGCNKSFEKANKKKIVKVNGNGGTGGLLGIAMMIAKNVDYPYYGLTLYADNFAHYYMFNKKGVDYQPYTNAFKWF